MNLLKPDISVIAPDEHFQQIKASFSIPENLETQETAPVLLKMSQITRSGFENTRMNPSQFYRGKMGPFYGIWINGHPNGWVEDANIGWEKTLQEVGKREDVHTVLDLLAHCYNQAENAYDWKNKGVEGFSVVANSEFGMEMGKGIGIQVSYPNVVFYIARAIRNKDSDKLKMNLISTAAEFVHERVHREYDQGPGIGTGSPEAISQGCQFLYMPGENVIFENQIQQTIDRAKKIVEGDTGERLDMYQHHNIVWMVFLQSELAKQYPDRFQALGSDGAKNIEELSKLTARVASLKRELGVEWKPLQQNLMSALIHYNPAEQEVIINDFDKNASEYGLEALVK